MQFEGAVIKEQGVTFALVVVKAHVVHDARAAEDAVRSFRPVFPRIPVVLMAQDAGGRATYFGRSDIAKFMAGVPIGSIPWRKYTLS
ncbi:MAG TPA: hypothetical protein VFC47_13320 [Caulobacteraceae bacterium]|nr:hypothetical protein [Caulobacteraceae bacterium]